MDEEPFLILHKVRGMPAFDIAHKLMIGDEEAWIIPTSGHRAYPCWNLNLKEVYLQDIHGAYNMLGWGVVPGYGPGDIPSDLPDHYACNDRPIRSEPASDFVRNLVNRMLPKMRRI